MNNGLMAKAGAGLGQGLVVAGQMGLHAQLQGDIEAQRGEIMAKRDAFLQGQENTRSAAKIASDQSIHSDINDTNLEAANIHANASRDVANIGLMGKSDKGTVVPKGAVALGADGKILYDNSAGDEDKLMAVPEGTKIIDKATRKEVFANPKDPNAEGLPKLDKDLDARIAHAAKGLAELFGGTYDQMGKLELKPGTENDVATGWKRLDEVMRANRKLGPEQAIKQIHDEIVGGRNTSDVPRGKSPKVNSILDNFGVR